MRIEIDTYQGVGYAYDNHPGVIKSIDDARSNGLNCETLTHFVLRDYLGAELPEEMRAMEIFVDTALFKPVPKNTSPELGDIFFFGKENETDPKKLHLAVFTGEINNAGSPLLIHANWQDRGVSIWPLDQFSDYKRYQALHAVKRFDSGGTEKE